MLLRLLGRVVGVFLRFVGRLTGPLGIAEPGRLTGPARGVLGLVAHLGDGLGELAQLAEFAGLSGDLGHVVAGDEERADIPDDGGGGLGLLAPVPGLADLLADEHVVQDLDTRVDRGATPVGQRVEVVTVSPLVTGVLGIRAPLVAERFPVVDDAGDGVDGVDDGVPQVGDIAPDTVDEQALADLPELIEGASEEAGTLLFFSPSLPSSSVPSSSVAIGS